MKSVCISLKMSESVKDFVNIVSKYSYEADLRSGKYIVDAKSILGVFCLDLSKPIVLEVHNDNCEDMLKDLKDFIV